MGLVLKIENETSLPDGGPLSVSIQGMRGIDIGRDRVELDSGESDGRGAPESDRRRPRRRLRTRAGCVDAVGPCGRIGTRDVAHAGGSYHRRLPIVPRDRAAGLSSPSTTPVAVVHSALSF